MAWPWQKGQRILGMLALGTVSFGGGLWLINPKAIWAWAVVSGEREATALLLAFAISLLLAGFPAGRVAGSYASKTFVPLWFAMAGTYLIPMMAWFTGFSPAWPMCWAAAFVLAFVGSWAGLGVGFLLTLTKEL